MKRVLGLSVAVAAAVLVACSGRRLPTAATAADAERDVTAAHEKRRAATLAADVATLD